MNVMTKKEMITGIVYDSIDQINELRAAGSQLNKSPDTKLFGESGQLDSLGLINLVVAVEDSFESVFGYSISLAESAAMSEHANPYYSVATLVDFIDTIVKDDGYPDH